MMAPFIRSFILVGFCFAGLVAASRGEQEVAGYKVPDNLATMEYVSSHDYEKTEPGLGQSLRYESESGMWANVYFYDLSQPSIPDGITSKITKAQFQQAIGDVKQHSEYRNVKVEKAEETIEAQGIAWLWAGFTYDNDKAKQKLASYLFVTAKDGQFIKVRFNGPIEKTTQTRQTARTFVSQLSRVLK